MILKVRHTLDYRYTAPATLGPQTIRLRPRSDGSQRLLDFSLTLEPEPSLRSACLDADGNVAEQAWFLGDSARFRVATESTVETLRRNPFDFVVDPAFARLPWGDRAAAAHPSSSTALAGAVEPNVRELSEEVARDCGGEALAFLMRLNRRIHGLLDYEPRPSGPPRPSGETLALGRGACRDFAVLFCAAARVHGIPARFVSGYHFGGPDRRARELHAWAEAFLPGAGWRGFDPSLGLACAEEHVALAAAPDPAFAAPLSGCFGPRGIESALEAEVIFL